MSGKTHSQLTRRSLLIAVVAAPLAACEGPFGVSYQELGSAIAVSTGLEPSPGITLAQAAAVPYATLGFRLGGSPESMLVLASKDNDSLLWTSAEHRALVTIGGRITKSAGFAWNLSNTSFYAEDPLSAGLQHVVPSGVTTRTADFNDISHFNVPIRSRFESKGTETITILGTEISTLVFAEQCRCEELDWDFDNAFWVDGESGIVWRSRQSIHPNLAEIESEILRPVA